jgi:hypothetical protein
MEKDVVFHLSTPICKWWDNIIHACASFQPFHHESDVDIWCERHAMPKGIVVPLPKMWQFASAWYGDYISLPWRKNPQRRFESYADGMASMVHSGLLSDP